MRDFAHTETDVVAKQLVISVLKAAGYSDNCDLKLALFAAATERVTEVQKKTKISYEDYNGIFDFLMSQVGPTANNSQKAAWQPPSVHPSLGRSVRSRGSFRPAEEYPSASRHQAPNVPLRGSKGLGRASVRPDPFVWGSERSDQSVLDPVTGPSVPPGGSMGLRLARGSFHPYGSVRTSALRPSTPSINPSTSPQQVHNHTSLISGEAIPRGSLGPAPYSPDCPEGVCPLSAVSDTAEKLRTATRSGSPRVAAVMQRYRDHLKRKRDQMSGGQM